MAGSRTLKLSILADVDNLKKNLDVGSKEVEGFGGKLEKFGKVAAAAFAAAAAAAAAYAGKLAIEGVKAAIEDEAAQLRLAKALKSVTDATDDQVKAVEDQISKTSLATGVADDKLRPALQKLVTSTGSLEKSQTLLNLALDISAGTGKDVDTVATALSKAYDGNTGALSRLNVGLGAAEIKSLGLEGATDRLQKLFAGAATTQAQTFEGKIARLSVAFDEAKEAVGERLLPIITNLIDYFVNTLIPKFQEAKTKAVDPIIKAFRDNEEALRDLWAFVKTYLVPIFEGALVAAIKGIGNTIAGVITIVAKVSSAIKGLVNDVIDAINAMITKYNSIPLLPNVGLIPKIATSSTMTGSIPTANLPFGGATLGGGTTGGGTGGSTGGGATGGGSTSGSIGKIPTVTGTMPTFPTGLGAGLGITAGSGFNPSGVRANDEKGNVIINVNAPSAIDEEGFTRAVVLALNNSTNRGTTGAGDLRTSAQIL